MHCFLRSKATTVQHIKEYANGEQSKLVCLFLCHLKAPYLRKKQEVDQNLNISHKYFQISKKINLWRILM